MKLIPMILSLTTISACGLHEAIHGDNHSPVYVPRATPTPTPIATPKDGQDGQSIVGPQGLPGESIKGDRGESGQSIVGPMGPAGINGTNATFQTKSFAVTASRDYNPSVFSPTAVTVNPGIYQFPTTLNVTGNMGTGWISVTAGGYKLCYQGAAQNNNTVSLQAKFKGYTTSDAECHNGVIPSKPELTVVEQGGLVVSVSGGGCASQCTLTTVTVNVKGIGVE